jgi:lipopolysaccharide transport system permease protein
MIPPYGRHVALVLELVRRDFASRYRGSFGGVLWSVLQPLFLLGVYTLAFGVALNAQWTGLAGQSQYALMAFAGLIVLNAFSECLMKAPTTIVSQPNFVKKIVFPLEVLPWVIAITATCHAFIATLIWFLGYAVLVGAPAVGSLLFFVVWIAFFPTLLAVGWLLSAIGVYLRDTSQISSMLAHTLLFLTPIFYSIDAVPPLFKLGLLANPLTYVVEHMRRALYFGELAAPSSLLVYFLISTGAAYLALRLFRKLRPGFADRV